MKTIIAPADVDFSGGWTTTWSTITTSFPTLGKVMLFAGIIILVFGLARFAWQKRKGGGASTSSLMWTVLVAALLTGPEAVLPILLKVVDLVINGLIAIGDVLF